MVGVEGTYITVTLPAKHYDPPIFTVDPSVGMQSMQKYNSNVSIAYVYRNGKILTETKIFGVILSAADYFK